MWTKNFLLDLLFPKTCLLCQREKNYLCEDCQALFEISDGFYCLCENAKRIADVGKCSSCRNNYLNGLYSALPYQNKFIQRLIHSFKYEPFAKDLAKPLSLFIINHLRTTGKENNFTDFILAPVPLEKRRLKWRGFNQAEELAKELSLFLKVQLTANSLVKTKTTLPQVELSEKEREENIKGAFAVKNRDLIVGKKILLIDDVYTTGATMAECARALKKSGAKEVWGMVIARG